MIAARRALLRLGGSVPAQRTVARQLVTRSVWSTESSFPAVGKKLSSTTTPEGNNGGGKWDLGGELATKSIQKKRRSRMDETKIADHSWRQTNHIWTEAELTGVDMSEHKPMTMSDYLMRGLMRTLYHSFNLVTGYRADDPSADSVAWRLIILESFAGVPGFVAAGFRHFHSLRSLRRDHGSIYTFLEEAENERMHLLVCLKVFEASWITKALVVMAQVTMTPFLALTYAINPGSMHRFVGYLEETAVLTYSNLIEKALTPGTKLHAAWDGLAAPEIAKSYWKLADDATWVETLRHILADESHHRDVNHVFATLPRDAENPFIEKHMADFDSAVVARVSDLAKRP